jgi:hypothetical protein
MYRATCAMCLSSEIRPPPTRGIVAYAKDRSTATAALLMVESLALAGWAGPSGSFDADLVAVGVRVRPLE